MRIETGDWKTGADITHASSWGKPKHLLFPDWSGQAEIIEYSQVQTLEFSQNTSGSSAKKPEQIIRLVLSDDRSAIVAMSNRELEDIVRLTGVRPTTPGQSSPNGNLPNPTAQSRSEVYVPAKSHGRYWLQIGAACLFAWLLITFSASHYGKTLPASAIIVVPPSPIATDAFTQLPKSYEKYSADIRKGAEMLVQQKTCDAISLADVSTKGTVKKLAFFYYCKKDGADGTINLTLVDIRAGNTQPKKPINEGQAFAACETYAKNHLNHPGSFSSGWLDRGTRTFMNGRREVTLKFKAKNGFNLELPFTATCLFMPKGDKYDMEGNVAEDR